MLRLDALVQTFIAGKQSLQSQLSRLPAGCTRYAMHLPEYAYVYSLYDIHDQCSDTQSHSKLRDHNKDTAQSKAGHTLTEPEQNGGRCCVA